MKIVEMRRVAGEAVMEAAEDLNRELGGPPCGSQQIDRLYHLRIAGYAARLAKLARMAHQLERL